MRHTGRCYCGAVHNAVDGPFAYALNCHGSKAPWVASTDGLLQFHGLPVST